MSRSRLGRREESSGIALLHWEGGKKAEDWDVFVASLPFLESWRISDPEGHLQIVIMYLLTLFKSDTFRVTFIKKMTPELYGGKPAREIYLGYVSDGQKPCATRGKPTQLSILKKAALLRLA